MSTHTFLKNAKDKLAGNLSSLSKQKTGYHVPKLWHPDTGQRAHHGLIKVDPAKYFIDVIEFIASQKAVPIKKNHGGTWTRDAVIYNVFVRTTTALDHSHNGKLDLPLNADGWRETGTFLKALAMIPYIKSLGANTIHLLPITSVGSDGNKGTLGSPYAIKNPYHIDENLHEPNAGLGVEEEFKLFVNAAHHLGMRVVVEFVFRTSSKDGDWIKEHPEWFYWIKESVKNRKPHHHDETEYGNPIFSEEELRTILGNVENGNYAHSIPPHEIYRNMFTIPPKPGQVKLEKGKYIGTLTDGTRVRIPGAFADWPPHDAQPPWGDVTYLKMFDHPDFNYIAYNTIRMYDTDLARKENINKSLWEKIAEIIPYYQHTYGIDGVMIDMGHALPIDLKHDMIHRARTIDPDFAFWDENFSITEKSVKEGYNAVIGYQWSDQHHPEKFKNMLRRFASEGFPLPFFATTESHNTPRSAARDGGVRYSKYAWTISNFIPAVPFIHSGFEIGEEFPINTGLDFTKEDLKKYPSETLPLFSEYAYEWANKHEFTEWIKTVSSLRKKYHNLIIDSSPESFIYIEQHDPSLLVFIRKSAHAQHHLLIVANSNMHKEAHFDLPFETSMKHLTDMLTGLEYKIESNRLLWKLHPGQVQIFEI